jgi:DinB superfamily
MKMYAQPTGNLTDAIERLARHLSAVNAALPTLSEAALTEHAPGKWSKQEILGHLTDSALHNLRRFTEAQTSPAPYPILPYNPDELVRVNSYNQLPISELLTLWTSLNRQIGWVVGTMQRERPALYDAPVVFASGETNTLGWLIEDYVAHLEHHLQTLL